MIVCHDIRSVSQGSKCASSVATTEKTVGKSGCKAVGWNRGIFVLALYKWFDRDKAECWDWLARTKICAIYGYANLYSAQSNHNFHANSLKLKTYGGCTGLKLISVWHRCTVNVFGSDVILQPWKLVNPSRFEHAVAFTNRTKCRCFIGLCSLDHFLGWHCHFMLWVFASTNGKSKKEAIMDKPFVSATAQLKWINQ